VIGFAFKVIGVQYLLRLCKTRNTYTN